MFVHPMYIILDLEVFSLQHLSSSTVRTCFYPQIKGHSQSFPKTIINEYPINIGLALYSCIFNYFHSYLLILRVEFSYNPCTAIYP